MMDIKDVLLQWFIIFLIKRSDGDAIKSTNKLNQQQAEELLVPIIRNFKKRKKYSSFCDCIWAADLADMQLISKYNNGIQFLLCVIDIYSKYAWVVPLKDKKGITCTNAFKTILDKSNSKSNKLLVDKGIEWID